MISETVTMIIKTIPKISKASSHTFVGVKKILPASKKILGSSSHTFVSVEKIREELPITFGTLPTIKATYPAIKENLSAL